MKNIVKRLRTKVLDLDQAEIAPDFGVNTSTICRWEQGRGEPSRSQIVRFCKRHPEIPVTEFFPELRP